jgi:hypothetical protein
MARWDRIGPAEASLRVLVPVPPLKERSRVNRKASEPDSYLEKPHTMGYAGAQGVCRALPQRPTATQSRAESPPIS